MQLLSKYSELKGARTDLRVAIPLKKPFSILFEPASMCNFRCTCCYYNIPNLHSHMPKGLMTLNNFKKISNDLAAWEGEQIKVIRLIGFGEPFINKNTAAMVKYLKQLNVAERIEITTNGSLLTSEVSQLLIDAELDYLRVSIYAATQDRHQSVTRNNMNINVIRSNIAELHRLRDKQGRVKPFIYVKMLDSFDEIENQRFFEQYAEIGDEVSLEQPHNWLSNDNDFKGSEVRMVCPQPFKMLSIRFNGDVIVCDPDWKNNTKVGNAIDNTLQSIWNGKLIHEFWKMQLENRRMENESCRNCTFLANDAYVLDNLDEVSPDVLKGN